MNFAMKFWKVVHFDFLFRKLITYSIWNFYVKVMLEKVREERLS